MNAILFVVFTFLLGAVQDETSPTPAELEWATLQEGIAIKVLRYREAEPSVREQMNFQKEMAAIGAFVRKYSESEPDYASAARVFLARELLSQVLGRDREAVQILRGVTTQAQSPLVAGLAAVHAAEILLRLDDEVGIAELRELYVARAEHEAQFASMLEDVARRAALRPGKPFPELKLTDLAGQKRTTGEFTGSVLLLFVFNVDHPGSRSFLQAAARAAVSHQEKGVAVLGISLDADAERLQRAMSEDKVSFPVCHEAKNWSSPIVKQLGISALPMSFVIDPVGRIQFVNPPSKQLPAFLDSAVDAARQAGLLKEPEGDRKPGE